MEMARRHNGNDRETHAIDRAGHRLAGGWAVVAGRGYRSREFQVFQYRPVRKPSQRLEQLAAQEQALVSVGRLEHATAEPHQPFHEAAAPFVVTL